MSNRGRKVRFKNILKKMFADIKKETGCIAEMNHLCCSNCATCDLEPRAKKKGQGMLYYHGQDEDNITNDDPSVNLRYCVKGDDEDAWFAWGCKVQHFAVKHGLKTEWAGDIGKTIVVSLADD